MSQTDSWTQNSLPAADGEGVRCRIPRDVTYLWSQVCVFRALVLHDIKSRYFGNGWGYVAMVLWPLIHIVIILGLNTGRLPPYGTSALLYASTAALPYIACNYVARFMQLGVMNNKSYLIYPIVKPLDLIVSRMFMEILTNFMLVILLVFGLTLVGVDAMPANFTQAGLAWLSCLFLGAGIGVFSCVVCLAFPMFQMIYILYIIIAWATCGITIDPERLPQSIAYYISFNPIMHAVEWMRSAYYPDYQPRLLDKSYLLGVAASFFALGLIMERLGRAYWLRSR